MGGALVPGMGQRTTFTDSEGRWSFGNVMDGAYVVTALAPVERQPRSADGPPDREQLFRESRQRFLVAQQELTVAGADLSGVGLSISGPGSIVGRVETDNNTALPANLVLFVEMLARLLGLGRHFRSVLSRTGPSVSAMCKAATSTSDSCSHPIRNISSKSVQANGDDPKQTALKVTEGAEAGPVQIVISEGVGTVTGRVLSEDGKQGMENVVVLLAPVAAEKQRFRTAYLSTRSASDGSFSISGPPGDYFIFARHRDDLPAIVNPDFVRRAAPTASRVVLASGETKRINVRRQ